MVSTRCVPLASHPESLNLSARSELAFDRTLAVPLDRETLLARFDAIRQFTRGGSVRPRAITVREDLRVRVARALAGSSARDLFEEFDGQPVRRPVDEQFHPSCEHLRWHHAQVFQGQT